MKKPAKARAATAALRRSRCPVSCTLDVLGDRWTLLVVRDLMRGKRRFAKLADSPERIPTNILADRLKRLVGLGVVQSRQYSDHPPRVEYQLTAKGEDLRPVLGAMVDWGIRHAGGRVPPPLPPKPEG
ncbi:MAG TPA: helix-turn-helix domain-containing protein [Vicinamibacterales bacterium]|jgi:DNA-binding HxlR family transcriptional regulator|nr:helix-turn-helix domain-containing protein [Vicinamibacterales bacterium]